MGIFNADSGEFYCIINKTSSAAYCRSCRKDRTRSCQSQVDDLFRTQFSRLVCFISIHRSIIRIDAAHGRLGRVGYKLRSQRQVFRHSLRFIEIFRSRCNGLDRPACKASKHGQGRQQAYPGHKVIAFRLIPQGVDKVCPIPEDSHYIQQGMSDGGPVNF